MTCKFFDEKLLRAAKTRDGWWDATKKCWVLPIAKYGSIRKFVEKAVEAAAQANAEAKEKAAAASAKAQTDKAAAYQKQREENLAVEADDWEQGPFKIWKTAVGTEVRLKSPKDYDLIADVKAIPGARWSTDGLYWEVERVHYPRLREIAEKYAAKYQKPDTAQNWEGGSYKIVLYKGGLAGLHSPYDTDLISRVKRIPGATWQSGNKAWMVPVAQYDALRALGEEFAAKEIGAKIATQAATKEQEQKQAAAGIIKFGRMGPEDARRSDFNQVGDVVKGDGDGDGWYVITDAKYQLGHGDDFSQAIFTARPATDEEARPKREAEERATRGKERAAMRTALAAIITAEGERPTPDEVTPGGEAPRRQQLSPEGEQVLGTANIYGGGDWFVVGPEWVWYVRNNGMDGDDWRSNNVATGGAGAIGWRVPRTQEMMDQIMALAAEGEKVSKGLVIRATEEAKRLKAQADREPIATEDAPDQEDADGPEPVRKGIRVRIEKALRPASRIHGIWVRIAKSRRVKGHWVTTASGKTTFVQEHQDRRDAAKAKAAAAASQRSLFGDEPGTRTASSTQGGGPTKGSPAAPDKQPQLSMFGSDEKPQAPAPSPVAPAAASPTPTLRDPDQAFSGLYIYAYKPLQRACKALAAAVQEGDPDASHEALGEALDALQEAEQERGGKGSDKIEEWIGRAEDIIQAPPQRVAATAPLVPAPDPTPKPAGPDLEMASPGLPAQPATPSPAVPGDQSRKQYKDAGEKIGGARKDIAQARKDFEEHRTLAALETLEREDPDAAARSVKKATIWPKPDLNDWREQGLDPGQAWFGRALWATVGTSPKHNSPELRADYFNGITALRGMIEGSTGGLDLAHQVQGWRSDVRLVQAWLNEIPGRAPKVWDAATRRSVDAPPATEYQKARYAQALAMGDFKDFIEDTKSIKGAKCLTWVNALKNGFGQAGDDREWHSCFTVWEEKPRKVARPSTGTAEGDVVQAWKPSRPKDYERLGDRDPVSVRDAQSVIDLFGVRGVEFGNWMDDKSSQVHVNRCVEAMVDLADGLGLDRNDVSVNGRLALAFGARGSGKFLAHYEPGKVVINLTKLGGAGTLAHEWFHFVDDMVRRIHHADMPFDHASDITEAQGRASDSPILQAMAEVKALIFKGGGKRVLKVRDKPQTRRYPQLDKWIAELGDGQAVMDRLLKEHPYYLKNDKLKKDLPALADYIGKKTGASEVTVPSDASQYYEDSLAVGKGKPSYWTETAELFARAFETYAVDALAAKGMGNNYLAFDENYKTATAPYPKDAERAALKLAFDKLIAAIRDQQTLRKSLAFLGGLLTR